MSGAEVLGLISATIQIIDAAIHIYNTANNVSGLPYAFRQVYLRLPLILDTLKAAESGLDDGRESSDGREALVDVLNSCKNKAALLEEILQSTISTPHMSRFKRWMKAIRTVSQGNDLQVLSDGILGDLDVLTSNYAVKSTTQQEIKRFIGLLTDQHGTSAGQLVTLNNMASGLQYIKLEAGNQNIASGGSIQINGPASGIFNYTAC